MVAEKAWKYGAAVGTLVGLAALAALAARVLVGSSEPPFEARSSPSEALDGKAPAAAETPRRFDPDSETDVVFEIGGIRLPETPAGPALTQKDRPEHSPAPLPGPGPKPPDTPQRTKSPEGSSTYVVAEGDTLGVIAQRLLGSAGRWKEIADLNGIQDPTRLKVGQKLLVP